MNRGARDDRGQVSAFVVTIALALILLFALVFEGGSALARRSRALTLAQEAARAGAQQLDLSAYRTGQPVDLDAQEAHQAAQDFLDQAGAHGNVEVAGVTVLVTARLPYTFTLLPLGERTVSGTASARPTTAP